jgi:hypothetical protein
MSALVGALLVATPAHAAKGNFGAIAYSPDDQVYAWVNHLDSMDAAIEVSVEVCEKKKGSGCDWAVWNSHGCLALAVDDEDPVNELAGGIGATKKLAFKDNIKYGEENGYTIDADAPLTAFCTSDTGADQG